ncbi:hypothetical protein [Candidatus Uabimicrobium sp. HlEnr_7]|uniref:hypothetical protein n=1 Tax=Candidatus Uabimicrobium helgolandensis TaxID=3095367 RepID=UPI003556131B
MRNTLSSKKKLEINSKTGKRRVKDQLSLAAKKQKAAQKIRKNFGDVLKQLAKE